MSDIATRVKAIIVDKLGVDEKEVRPRQVLQMTLAQILWTLLSSSWSLKRSSTWPFLMIKLKKSAQ